MRPKRIEQEARHEQYGVGRPERGGRRGAPLRPTDLNQLPQAAIAHFGGFKEVARL